MNVPRWLFFVFSLISLPLSSEAFGQFFPVVVTGEEYAVRVQERLVNRTEQMTFATLSKPVFQFRNGGLAFAGSIVAPGGTEAGVWMRSGGLSLLAKENLLAFNLTFTDGSQGIFTTAVPEPGTIVLASAAGMVILGVGLRRWRRHAA